MSIIGFIQGGKSTRHFDRVGASIATSSGMGQLLTSLFGSSCWSCDRANDLWWVRNADDPNTVMVISRTGRTYTWPVTWESSQ